MRGGEKPSEKVCIYNKQENASGMSAHVTSSRHYGENKNRRMEGY